MRSGTFKWIILVCTIITGLLVAAQVFWLNRIYNYEQKEFNSGVIKSIKGVYESFNIIDSNNAHTGQLIEQSGDNIFLFRFDVAPPKDSFLNTVLNNLEDFEVFADCKLGFYDIKKKSWLFQQYLPSEASRHSGKEIPEMPAFQKDYSFAVLYFPYRNKYILSEMRWWILSSILLLLILIALGFSMFHLYRQKFLNEVQNDFIRNVTHEFQTPLTTLTVGLDMISKGSIAEHPDKLEKYTKLMQGQTEYLKHHIENLVQVMKADATGMAMEKEAVNPNELVKAAVSQLYGMIEEKKAKIELNLDDENKSVMADANNLYTSVLNLLSNAIKYSKEPVVVVETKCNETHYTISVKDNGVGISKQFQNRLFKKFYRVPTGDVHNVKGLGLGLYFVKKVVNAHKGKINVNSIPGIGSEFIIDIPVK
jgi:two-component system phosphate regulon sensor histidine kinase PhoR